MGKFLHCFIIINEVAGEWINIQWHYMLNTVEIRGEITYLEERLLIQKPRDHTSM
jgi:hypothetical protein